MMIEKTILIVDDESCFREFASDALSAAGFLTSVAGDGHDAIHVLEVIPFDLVVVDIVMPEKEGIETIIEIKRRWPDCKVVAMAGDARVPAAQYLRIAAHFGADALLAKPFTAAEIIATATSLLHDRAAAPPRAA